jgi:nicotinamidase-related amidase
MIGEELPIPEHFDKEKIEQVWKVNYQEMADKAKNWAREHGLSMSGDYDSKRICLLLVDCQNTFCTPGYELFVAGRSGDAAVGDSRRICEFIYRNLGNITRIVASLDTHTAMQVFHPLFLIDSDHKHPRPMTEVSAQEVEEGRWRVNPAAAAWTGKNPEELQKYLLHYCRRLEETGKYKLMIWPYHSMVGGTGHSLVSTIEEAVFFHSIARQALARFEVKGSKILTENYSVFGPEVTHDEKGNRIAEENSSFVDTVLDFDMTIVAGQAKSHCVAWSMSDLLEQIEKRDPALARKVYLMEDCTSPVVIPDGPDFTEQADEAFQRFAQAGMHLVKSSEPISSWPDV